MDNRFKTLWTRGGFAGLSIIAISALSVASLQGQPNGEATTTLEEEPALKLDFDPLERGNATPVLSYADMLEGVTPSVVAVFTRRIVAVRQNRMDPQNPLEDFLRRYYGMPAPETQPQEPEREREQAVGAGSGVIVTEDGYVLTNNHVISDRGGEVVDRILVRLSDGREIEAELIGRDPQTDVAVLKIESDDPLPAVTLADSENIRVGDVVFAIGNPLSVGVTVTQGIVSATNRTELGILGRGGFENFIQTDASINMGNSGGALIDARGRLVGINTAILSRTGGNIGIGFAIPSNLARDVMLSLVSDGEVQRGFLGIIMQSLTPELAEAFDLKLARGAVVLDVAEDTPAEAAGLRAEDIVTAVDGKEIDSSSELRLMIAQMPPGSEVELSILRGGEEITKTVTLGSLKAGLAGLGTEVRQGPLEGVSVVPLSDVLREQYEVPSEIEKAVVVTEVAPDSPHFDSLTAGVVIIRVNGARVTTLEELGDALQAGVNRIYGWDGQYGFTLIRVE
ncbi:MAG: Do family serine endopeptidase [Verrucomicrobiota bacterium]